MSFRLEEQMPDVQLGSEGVEKVLLMYSAAGAFISVLGNLLLNVSLVLHGQRELVCAILDIDRFVSWLQLSVLFAVWCRMHAYAQDCPLRRYLLHSNRTPLLSVADGKSQRVQTSYVALHSVSASLCQRKGSCGRAVVASVRCACIIG